MSPRLARWFRSLSLMLVLTILLPTLPAPMRTAAAPASCPAAARPLAPAAPLLQGTPKTPAEAHSSSLTVAEATPLMQQEEVQHTFGGTVDGTFSATRRLLHTEELNLVVSGVGITMSSPFILPASHQDSLEADVIVTAHQYYGAHADLCYRPVGSTEAYRCITLADALGYQTTTKTVRLQLVDAFPVDQSMDIQLKCAGHSGKEATCTLAELRRYEDAPGWHLERTNSGAPGYPTPWFFMRTTDEPYRGLEPYEGAFLALETLLTGTYGGAFHNDAYFESAVVRLPSFTSTDPLMGSFVWSRVILPHPDPKHNPTMESIHCLKFVDQETKHVTDLKCISAGADAPWTLASLRFPSSLSGRAGRFQFVLPARNTPRVIGIDNFIIAHHGQPITLAMDLDQLVGKGGCDTMPPCGNIHGDPVNTLTGFFLLTEPDLQVPTTGPPLQASRTYVSLFADPATYPVTASPAAPIAPAVPGSAADVLARRTLPPADFVPPPLRAEEPGPTAPLTETTTLADQQQSFLPLITLQQELLPPVSPSYYVRTIDTDEMCALGYSLRLQQVTGFVI